MNPRSIGKTGEGHGDIFVDIGSWPFSYITYIFFLFYNTPFGLHKIVQ